jgi:pimeloyl-ACP methyl ester carboxylesterase
MSLKQMTVNGVEIAYLDRGNGPPVIIAHCSSASHREWLPLIEALEPDWRVLAPDFIGYGQSGPWPEGKVFTSQADLAVLTAVSNGNDRDAASAFMRYWLGRLRWWLAPEKFKAAITATIRKVALEFMILIEAGARLSDYASVTAPTLLIVGGKTRAPARAVVDMLSQALPNATTTVLRGAGHMSPFTHPSEVNRLIAGHLAAQRQQELAPLPEA